MGKLIRVKARDAATRQALARWGRRHRGVRTVSHVELGFPPEVFALIPEDLLVGGLVDSRAYTPAVKARPRRQPVFLKSVPTSPATQPQEQERVEEATVVTDVDAGLPEGTQPPADTGPYPVEETVTIPTPPSDGAVECPVSGCGYVAKTRRGLNVHVGRRHRDESV